MCRLLIISYLLLFVSTNVQSQVIFSSNRDGNFEIYMMENDGGDVQRLTHNNVYDSVPRWSPNGKQIAFFRNMDARKQQFDIFIMDADGNNEKRLTDHPAADGGYISWAPDGKRIAFRSDRTGQANIHTIDVVNLEVQQLTQYEEGEDTNAKEPSWSPDGKYIAYVVDALPDGGWTTVYIMDADGKRQRPLLKGEGTYRSKPRWSPDSKYIMYCDSKYGPQLQLIFSKIVVCDKNGKLLKERQMPDGWLVDSTCWTENRNQIIIAAKDPNRQYDIYRYSFSGNSVLINLTNHMSRDLAPDYWWKNTTLDVSPTGKKSTQWGQLKKFLISEP